MNPVSIADALFTKTRQHFQDACVEGLSEQGRFSMVYNAAHAMALAALRWHGYRSDSRYLVFQCLQRF